MSSQSLDFYLMPKSNEHYVFPMLYLIDKPAEQPFDHAIISH
jgi:hypothetical protein